MSTKRFVINGKRWPGVYGYSSEKRRVQGKPDLCYHINYRLDGKLKWEKVGWKSEGYSPQIAAEVRNQRMKDARHGKTVKTAKDLRLERIQHDRTIGEIKEDYFNSEKGLNLKGRITDLNRYELHIEPSLGAIRVSDLEVRDIELIKREMKNKAPATVANTLELLRRLINHGIKNKLCLEIYFTIELPKTNNQVTEYLTHEEADKFIKVLNEWPNQDVSRMLKLSMFTGMRRGEVFNLKVKDLDFQQLIINIRAPKGGVDTSIPMSEISRQILTEQLEWKENKRSKKKKDKRPDSQFVFPTYHGKARVDSSAVKRIKAKAALPKKFRIFHGLRHHLGVTLANSGEYTLDMIGELLTHKSPAVTKRYAQFLPHTKRKAAERATELLMNNANIRDGAKDGREKK